MVVEPIVWLVILIVLIVIEIITLGLTTIWFAGGALAAFIAALAGGGIGLQIGLFLVVSVVMLIFTRPVAVRYLNSTRTHTNVIDTVIGKQAIVLEDIRNLQGSGKVLLNGIEWTARSASDTQEIVKNSVVYVTQIDGVKLIVERKGELL